MDYNFNPEIHGDMVPPFDNPLNIADPINRFLPWQALRCMYRGDTCLPAGLPDPIIMDAPQPAKSNYDVSFDGLDINLAKDKPTGGVAKKKFSGFRKGFLLALSVLSIIATTNAYTASKLTPDIPLPKSIADKLATAVFFTNAIRIPAMQHRDQPHCD